MPIMTKENLDNLHQELVYRYSTLLDVIKPRKLKSAREGAGKNSHWTDVDAMTATVGDAMAIRMAVEDFKNILAEIKRLK